jgi:quercetin dioxygenase-like cupin family protein
MAGPDRTSRVASWTREDAALDTRIRRRLFSARRTMIVLVRILPEPHVADHVHSLDQITIVLRGRVEARTVDGTLELHVGQSIRIPAGTAHALRCLGPDSADTLNLFLPRR